MAATLHRQMCPLADIAAGAGRTAAVLADASNCLQGSVELKLPDPKYAAAYELKPGSFNAAASDPDVARHMDECLADWCRQVRIVLPSLPKACVLGAAACLSPMAVNCSCSWPQALPWTVQVEGLLERSSAPAAGEEPGPDTELEHWRQQMSRFNSLMEQLKSHECRLVLGVTSMAHSQVRAGSGVGYAS